jgi:hypothetical protein
MDELNDTGREARLTRTGLRLSGLRVLEPSHAHS